MRKRLEKAVQYLITLSLVFAVMVMLQTVSAAAEEGTESNLLEENLHTVSLVGDSEGCTIVQYDNVGKSDLAFDGSAPVRDGDDFVFTVTLDSAYKTYSELKVYADGTLLTADTAGRYTVSDVKSDVSLVVAGITDQEDGISSYSVSYTCPEGFEIVPEDFTSGDQVNEGYYIHFKAAPKEMYSQSEFSVLVNGEEVASAGDDEYAIQIKKDTKVTVSGDLKLNTCETKYVFDDLLLGLVDEDGNHVADGDYYKTLYNVKVDGKEITNGEIISNIASEETHTMEITFASEDVNSVAVFRDGVLLNEYKNQADASITYEYKITESSTVVLAKKALRMTYTTFKNTAYGVAWEFSYPEGYSEYIPYGYDYYFNICILEGYRNSAIQIYGDYKPTSHEGMEGRGDEGYYYGSNGESCIDGVLVSADKDNGIYTLKFTDFSSIDKLRVVSKNADKPLGAVFLTPDTYTVNYLDSADNSLISTDTITYGGTVSERTPTKSGYEFMGWYTSTGKKYDFKETVTGNLNLFAKWKRIYTVTLKVDEDTILTQELSEGDTVSKPSAPTRNGYKFINWYTTEDTTVSTAYDFDTPVTEDFTLYARWRQCCYVTFDSDGGTDFSNKNGNVEFGSKVRCPAAEPEKDGYTFLGWYLKDAAETYDFSQAVTEQTPAIALTARWGASLGGATVSSIKDQVYTGSAFTPAVTVKVNGKKLVKGTDYKISYSSNKAIGMATVTITGMGKYNGAGSIVYSGTRKLTFRIVPKATKLTKIKSYSGRKVKLTWKKVSGVDGYIIYRSTSKTTGYKKIKALTKAASSYTDKTGKAGKKYYYKIVAAKVVNGYTYPSAYSNYKYAKVKK